MIILLGLFLYGGIDSLKYVIANPLTPEEFGMLRANSGVQGWISSFYSYSITALGRFVGFLFLGVAIYKKRRLETIVAYAYLILIFIGLMANLSKSSAVVFLFQIVVFHSILYNKAINFSKALLFLLLSIVLFAAIYLFTTTAEDIPTALSLFSHRIFGEPNRVLAQYTEYYPNIYPHTYGLNIRLVHSLIGTGEFISSDALLAGNIIGATVNTIFIGDAWVDFGYWGVMYQSLFLGAYLAILDYIVFNKKNLYTKAMCATLILGILSLSSIALLACLIGFGLLSIPIFSVLFKIKFR
ncbi:hypothetical protein AEM51_06785 [Bacteroidetes bacterium UKL13-3]|nr:hypothetical protein AEM51_06785 [Bacteroidetes bacterium UKL13-3]